MRVSKGFAIFTESLIIKRKSESTIKNTNFTKKCFIDKIGDIEVSEIDALCMFKFTEKLDGYAESTKQSYCTIIRACLRHLKELGHDLPYPELLTIPSKPKRLPRFLEPSVIDHLIEVEQDPRNKALIAVLYSTGARNAEVRNMKVKNYNRDTILLEVTKTKVERYVRLSHSAKKLLDNYLDNRRYDSPYLFSSMRQERLGSNTINCILKKLSKQTGVDLYPHLFRHSHATNFLASTGNIRFVQESLGHANIQTTVLYTHVKNDELARAHRLAFV